MRIYNTLSRTVELFKPLQPPEVKLYACGPTVYDYAHLGHLRKYTMDDILVRQLQHEGYHVKFVQNVTDVGHLVSDGDTGDDKLEKGAKKYQLDVWSIARKFEEYFAHSMQLMGNQIPTVVCRATEHIPQMLAMVQKLEKAGYTYIIEGDGVYFDTEKFPDYGQMAGLNLDELKAGARVEMVEGKKHPTDFALWKFERPGENRQMAWASPWHKRSFPGWHIECSAMSQTYLGDQLDIHTGGIDHIPVHHTNEIAQSEAATGKKPFVKYWIHHNFLLVEGEKMSKSKDNFFTVDDLLEKGFEPMALRLLFLGAHYRSELNFTWASMSAAQLSWQKLCQVVAELKEKEKGTGPALSDQVVPSHAGLSSTASSYQTRFFEFMNDDLNTPAALALMWTMIKDRTLSAFDKLTLFKSFNEVFGLRPTNVNTHQSQSLNFDNLPQSIQQLVSERQQARLSHQYQLADQLRQQLAEAGYRVIDQGEQQQVFYD